MKLKQQLKRVLPIAIILTVLMLMSNVSYVFLWHNNHLGWYNPYLRVIYVKSDYSVHTMYKTFKHEVAHEIWHYRITEDMRLNYTSIFYSHINDTHCNFDDEVKEDFAEGIANIGCVNCFLDCFEKRIMLQGIWRGVT